MSVDALAIISLGRFTQADTILAGTIGGTAQVVVDVAGHVDPVVEVAGTAQVIQSVAGSIDPVQVVAGVAELVTEVSGTVDEC